MSREAERSSGARPATRAAVQRVVAGVHAASAAARREAGRADTLSLLASCPGGTDVATRAAVRPVAAGVDARRAAAAQREATWTDTLSLLAGGARSAAISTRPTGRGIAGQVSAGRATSGEPCRAIDRTALAGALGDRAVGDRAELAAAGRRVRVLNARAARRWTGSQWRVGEIAACGRLLTAAHRKQPRRIACGSRGRLAGGKLLASPGRNGERGDRHSSPRHNRSRVCSHELGNASCRRMFPVERTRPRDHGMQGGIATAGAAGGDMRFGCVKSNMSSSASELASRSVSAGMP